MLLYFSGSKPSFVDKVLCDSSGAVIYKLKTRCMWKSESPSVPKFRQTEIIDAKSEQVIAQIDWDGERPVYIDLGKGDERLVHEMVFPIGILRDMLLFKSPGDFIWEVTAKAIILDCDASPNAFARYYPHSRVTSDGKLEPVSPGSKTQSAKDWLEINVLQYGDISIAELLVDFIVLEYFRRFYFSIKDPESHPTPPSSQPLQRLRQAVF